MFSLPAPSWKAIGVGGIPDYQLDSHSRRPMDPGALPLVSRLSEFPCATCCNKRSLNGDGLKWPAGLQHALALSERVPGFGATDFRSRRVIRGRWFYEALHEEL